MRRTSVRQLAPIDCRTVAGRYEHGLSLVFRSYRVGVPHAQDRSGQSGSDHGGSDHGGSDQGGLRRQGGLASDRMSNARSIRVSSRRIARRAGACLVRRRYGDDKRGDGYDDGGNNKDTK